MRRSKLFRIAGAVFGLTLAACGAELEGQKPDGGDTQQDTNEVIQPDTEVTPDTEVQDDTEVTPDTDVKYRQLALSGSSRNHQSFFRHC